jgi:hypothetical protein
MKKVIRLNENDIEKLVKKIIREDDEQQPQQPVKEKSLVLLKTNNGELSTVDDIITTIGTAEKMFEELCSKVTGEDGHAKEIDGIRSDFLKLKKTLLNSKETIGTFLQQKSRQDHMSYMKKKQQHMSYMKKKAEDEGRYYS